jgi:hypothetical protein
LHDHSGSEMNDRRFRLQPFPATGPMHDLKIMGEIVRRSSMLTVCYALIGPMSGLAVPAPAEAPDRRSRLWEETCLELFLAVEDFPTYWEFNLSPAGHWNVYRFTDYRQGMREETAFAALPFSIENRADSLLLAMDLDLDRIVREDQHLEVAISAVIKHLGGEMTRWALTHPGPQPDFHLRDSFIIEL